MSEIDPLEPSPSSWRASRERGRKAQTGSERGAFRYRQQHPEHPLLVFDYYRKRSDESHQEVWVLAEEMETRHKQRLARNLARARERGVPPRRPAAPKAERKRKARIRQEKMRQKKRKQDTKRSAQEDLKRWEILALSMGVSVEEIMPQ
jgi:hypothetical protein